MFRYRTESQEWGTSTVSSQYRYLKFPTMVPEPFTVHYYRCWLMVFYIGIQVPYQSLKEKQIHKQQAYWNA